MKRLVPTTHFHVNQDIRVKEGILVVATLKKDTNEQQVVTSIEIVNIYIPMHNYLTCSLKYSLIGTTLKLRLACILANIISVVVIYYWNNPP